MEKIDVKEIKMCGCNIILLYKKMEKKVKLIIPKKS